MNRIENVTNLIASASIEWYILLDYKNGFESKVVKVVKVVHKITPGTVGISSRIVEVVQ